jgi:hypothetical protein
LKQEMARFSLAIPATNQIWTADPAKLKPNSMGTDAPGLHSVGQMAQSFRPAETVEDVDP